MQKMGSMFGDAMPALGTAVTSFANAIDKLTGFKMGVDINSIPPISVNIAMPQILPEIEKVVFDAIEKELPSWKATGHGLQRTSMNK